METPTPTPSPEPTPLTPSALTSALAPAPSESRLVTRLLAFIVICVGLGLVGYVFLTAKQLFDAPTVPLPTPAPTPKPLPGAPPAPDNTLGIVALEAGWRLVDVLGRRLLSLLVMCIAGSLIAALGIRWWGKR